MNRASSSAVGIRLARVIPERWARSPTESRPSLDTLTDEFDEGGSGRLIAPPPPRAVSPTDRTWVLRMLQVTLLLVVLGQRITIPIGPFPVSLPLLAVLLSIPAIRLRGGLRYNRVRTELYIAAVGAIMAAAWFTTWQGDDISITSLLLLMAIYLPWVFCVAAEFLDLVVPLYRTFVVAMVVAAAVGAAQMAAQLVAGWTYTDYLAQVLPPGWLDLNFNTRNQISYFNPVVKANAFVFLEPSFLCQFCALALIISLLVRAPAWQPLVLGLGMASTLSGTGILLLALGVALLVVLVPNRIRPSYLIAGIIGLAVLFSTPAADILLDRRSETTQQGSSGYLRFVQPYDEVSRGLAVDPTRYVVGAGPGSADRLLASDRSGGEAVVYSIAPKVAFEYGLISAVLFVAFLLVCIYRGPPVPVLPTVIVFMLFFLSGSLLQPHTVFTGWLLTSVWGPPVTVGLSDALAGRLRSGRQSLDDVQDDDPNNRRYSTPAVG